MTEQRAILDKAYRQGDGRMIAKHWKDYEELERKKARVRGNGPEAEAERYAIDLEMQSIENFGSDNGYMVFMRQKSKRSFSRRVAESRKLETQLQRVRFNVAPGAVKQRRGLVDQIVDLRKPGSNVRKRISEIRSIEDQISATRRTSYRNGARAQEIRELEKKAENLRRTLPVYLR